MAPKSKLQDQTNTTAAEEKAPDEPQGGGRYVRNGDGSLTQTHATEPSAGRVKRDQAESDEPAADPQASDAPGGGTDFPSNQE